MALQSVVNSAYALGTPGCKATPDQSIYTVENYFVASGGVVAGTFAWLDSAGELVNTGSGTPVGFVQRDVYYPMFTVNQDGGMVIPEGESATVAKKGDYYAQMVTSCTAGQTVYATQSATLTTTSASGLIDTGWKIAVGAASGGTCIISNW